MATLTPGRTMATWVILSAVVCGSPGAGAEGLGASGQSGPLLEVGEARLDRPTLTALGVQLLFAGDSNQDASVEMRFREAGATSWRDAQPLHRVRPGLVRGLEVDLQFAGNVSGQFDIDTFNGGIDNCFGPKAQRTSKYAPGMELSFSEGDGDARVTVSTVNGDISICK